MTKSKKISRMKTKLTIITALFFILMFTGCSDKTPKAMTADLLLEMKNNNGQYVINSFYRDLNDKEQHNILNVSKYTQQLINKYGLPSNPDSITVENITIATPKDIDTQDDSIIVIANHVPFGMQKEVPLPDYVVHFFYSKIGRYYQLINLYMTNVKDPETILEFEVPFVQGFDFDYDNLVYYSLDYDGGNVEPNIYLRKEEGEQDIFPIDNADLDYFIDLLVLAKVDSTYKSKDIYRTNGLPAKAAISLKFENDSLEWMIFSTMKEEPHIPEPQIDFLEVRQFKYVNLCNVYVINKKENEELNRLFELLVKSGINVKHNSIVN